MLEERMDREGSGGLRRRMEAIEDDLQEVKDYVGKVYEKASASWWSALLLDKSQSLVTGATLMIIITFLWCAAMTGMWGWGIYPEMSVGFTMFCASFAWSSIRRCHILPGESLSCPPDFRWAQCISWYDPHFTESTGVITAMQAVSCAGLLSSLLNTICAFHTVTRVKDQVIVRWRIKILAIGAGLNAILCFVTFVLFLNFPYANQIFSGEGCILLKMSNGIQCVPVSNFEHKIGQGFALSTTVIAFIASLLCTAGYAMGYRIENFDIEKEE